MSDLEPRVKSIAELARIAGLSVSTVSRALTDKGALSRSTRERVQKLAEEYGFKLNVSAQNLRMGRTRAIAVLLPLGHERGQHLSDPFFMVMLSHLADELTGRGYDLVLSRVLPSDNDWLDGYVRSGRTDGIVIIGQSDQQANLDRVGSSYRPMVVWGAYSPLNHYVTVGTDNFAGGQLAAKHLIDRGRRKLAYFGNVEAPEFAVRYQGFLSVLPEALRVEAQLVPAHLTPESSYAEASEYFRAGNRPDGVFAASDIVAMSVISAAAEHGVHIPDDMSLVGFDDIQMARLTNPPLTTIRQDIGAGARLLIDLLFRRMEGEDAQSMQIAPSLIVREST